MKVNWKHVLGWKDERRGIDRETTNSASICIKRGQRLAVRVFVCRLQYSSYLFGLYARLCCQVKPNALLSYIITLVYSKVLQIHILALMATILCNDALLPPKFPFVKVSKFWIPGQWTTYAGWLMFQNSYFICRQRYADFCILHCFLFISAVNHKLSKVFIHQASCKLTSGAKYFAV